MSVWVAPMEDPKKISAREQLVVGEVVGTPEPSRQEAMPLVPGWVGPVFVWGVGASMMLAALVFVAAYSGNVPFWDDWTLVP